MALQVRNEPAASAATLPKLDFDWTAGVSPRIEPGESKTHCSDHTEGGSRQGIVEFLRGKKILITGATGFLAKVLVEKILREQPDVGHLYLVIQRRSDVAPSERLQGQVISSQVFDVLRESHVDGYSSFMGQKVTAVEGNISSSGLGFLPGVRDELLQSVDVIINSAATTTFDERYDVALSVNTLGVRRLVEFASSCKNLKLLCHVSTAFTNGTRTGQIKEKPFEYGVSITSELSGGRMGPRLDIDEELHIAEAALKEPLNAKEQTKDRGDAISARMVDLGMERARIFGWQDTYVFTKAMGEMLLSKASAELPIVILRPSIIEGALRQPLLGWMEGIRMMDPILLAYGKGQMYHFLADPECVLDVVPVDFVINAILAALPKHAGRVGVSVYHVATSVANPMSIRELCDNASVHFMSNPIHDRHNQPIRLRQKFIPSASPLRFFLSMWLQHQLPLQLKKLFPWGDSTSRLAQKRNNLTIKTFQQLNYLAKIYQPYTFYSGRFDSSNTEQLYNELTPEEKQRFFFDLKEIDWPQYIVDVHLPGLRKYVLKGRGSSQ